MTAGLFRQHFSSWPFTGLSAAPLHSHPLCCALYCMRLSTSSLLRFPEQTGLQLEGGERRSLQQQRLRLSQPGHPGKGYLASSPAQGGSALPQYSFIPHSSPSFFCPNSLSSSTQPIPVIHSCLKYLNLFLVRI